MITDDGLKILSIDIGGSNVKATVLNAEGAFLHDYEKLPTPSPATPGRVLDTIKKLVGNFASFDKIATGFPGYVKDGVIKTAPNLGTEQWVDFNLQKNLVNFWASLLLSLTMQTCRDSPWQAVKDWK